MKYFSTCCLIVIFGCAPAEKAPLQSSMDDGGTQDIDQGVPDAEAPSCSDGVLNQNETSIDCGGDCDACGVGLVCSEPTDCESMVCLDGVCVAPACDDGVSNGTESDTDCGGEICQSCADGQACARLEDCQSGVCVDDVCLAMGCADGETNGDESDVDCGGSCRGCTDGGACALDDDCLSGYCFDGVCQAPSCEDQRTNGSESDVDCGGAMCSPCEDGAACRENTDCLTANCLDAQCVPARCDDGIRNGNETDDDCGGLCDACEPGSGCSRGPDCTSGVCSAGLCAEASCFDGVQNGGETDVDCGTRCDACSVGNACREGRDCMSAVCQEGQCVGSNCNDGAINGDESDVDCGGSCGLCEDGQRCQANDECRSGLCNGGVCEDAGCDDGVRNGAESDVDCGGQICGGCGVGQRCRANSDCAGGVCENDVCTLSCPGDWDMVNLESVEGRNEWRYAGSTTLLESNAEGSCGGGVADQIHRFVPTAGGLYGIEVTGRDLALRMPVVHLRNSCADIRSEQACEVQLDPYIGMTAELEANEAVYLFVDGSDAIAGGSRGDYELRVSPYQTHDLVQAQAWLNPANGAVLAQVEGVAGSFAVANTGFRFLDAMGRTIGPPEPFLRGGGVETNDGPDGLRFTGDVGFNPEFAAESLANITQVELTVGDRSGERSNALTVPLRAPTPVALDEPCDAGSARTVCPDGAECFSDEPQRDPTPRCHMVEGFCPPEWDVVTLDALQIGNQWVYNGNLNRFQDDLDEHGLGSCAVGATGFNDVLSFRAPQNGNYQVLVETQGDTIVWVRHLCDVEGPDAELGCNDDDPSGQAGRGSRINVTGASWRGQGRLFGLLEGESMYIFVDSYGDGGRGQYTVRVSPL